MGFRVLVNSTYNLMMLFNALPFHLGPNYISFGTLELFFSICINEYQQKSINDILFIQKNNIYIVL